MNMLAKLIAVLAMSLLSVCHANNSKLTKVTQEIKQVKKQLKKAQEKRNRLNQQLEKIEVSISNVAKQLEKTNLSLFDAQAKLSEINSQKEDLSYKLKGQSALMAKHLRAHYSLKDPELLKLLINQQNPQDISRYLKYYELLSRERVKLLKGYKENLQLLDKKQTQLKAHRRELRSLYETYVGSRDKLQKRYEQRNQIVKRLGKFISSKEESLEELVENKAALEKIIRTFPKKKQVSSQTVLPGRPFTKRLKGKLSLPTKGAITQKFGAKIQGGRLTSNGVLIQTNHKQEVYAIYHGKVVFSNWLKGFGLLLIIEHDNGYMSLYAHNHTLYKKQGDLVKKGDLISRSGQSGGLSKNSLYFEIRKDGNPINPIHWCV